ncbi:MAG: ABC transporter permease [Cyanobacteria bacterium SIG31]|nr:ABC transporter permease [Cyanobacteria bacterium SIG31]
MDNSRHQLKKQVKKHIPKDWLCELRIAYRILMEAVNDIKRTGIINLVIITTMAAILTIFGILFRFTISLSTFAGELGNVLEISVYLRQDANSGIIKDRVREIKHVKSVRLIPKAESWDGLRKELGLQNDMANPLPDTLRVRVDKPENITDVFNQIKSVSGVEDMGYAKELAKKIQFLTNIVNTTMVFVVIISAALTITIINNTIQLVIQSRKEEIEIMRLMGVSNWYIKTPLVMQGAFYGFVASIIAVLPLNWIQGLLLNIHKFFLIPAPAYAQNIVIISLLLIGTAFGASGSLLSIKKHLQV